jgi:hypothetical protein
MVVDISQSEAREFIHEHHYSKSCPNTSVARHGLMRFADEELRGVAMWLPPTKVAAQSVAGERWREVLCLTRFCIHPDAPANAASFLLGRSMRLLDRKRWPFLLTYADTAVGHHGGIYLATNWKRVGEVRAGDVWVGPNGERRGRKRGGWNYSTQQMREMGFVRAPQLPKVKFVHHKEEMSA